MRVFFRQNGASCGWWRVIIGLVVVTSGCQLFVDDADREVSRLIASRQQAAVGRERPLDMEREKYPSWRAPYRGGEDDAYAFVPHPVDLTELDDIEAVSTQPASAPAPHPPDASQPDVAEPPASTPAESALVDSQEVPLPGMIAAPEKIAAQTDETSAMALPATTQPATYEVVDARMLTLEDTLNYAFHRSREFQTAKEDLYLAALALSLERHLWTPQLVGEIRSRYANYGQIRDFDHAMDAVAEVAVAQKLPYGGEVTASVIGSLMRDLTHHLTSGETGQMVLAANIPLLRGAGRVAYESRYQAERDLIYAVRAFERFHQVLAVDIAGDYLNLQQLKQGIINETESIRSFTAESDRARARGRLGRILELEVQRADQDRLIAINRRVDAVEGYESALDRFKIRIGMPVEERIDVVELGDPEAELTTAAGEGDDQATNLSTQMPRISDEEAVRLAHKYRLDLINVYDRIDDQRRDVVIAENNLLPALDATGSTTLVTNPTELGVFKYNTERTTWRAGLNLELPLDRKEERNALRGALIDQRRAERVYDEARDLVTLEVRRAMRRVLQQQESLRIQILNRDLALRRRQAARIRFNQARVSNREVIDAENALLDARNRLALAQAQVRLAILQFRRDTGTLQVASSEEREPDSNGG